MASYERHMYRRPFTLTLTFHVATLDGDVYPKHPECEYCDHSDRDTAVIWSSSPYFIQSSLQKDKKDNNVHFNISSNY